MEDVQQADHDALIRLEGHVAALTHTIETQNIASVERDTRIQEGVSAVEQKVSIQNGRVGKLESWKTQVTTVYGAIIFAAPFVFYALLRLFGA